MNRGNVGDMGKALKQTNLFCSKCIIVLNGCNVGNAKDSIAGTLAAETGCSVLAPLGWTYGAFATGNIRVTKKLEEAENVKVDDKVYNPPKDDRWSLTN